MKRLFLPCAGPTFMPFPFRLPRTAEQTAFTVPSAEGSLEESYEITFWAKNDTNMRQTDIYRRAIEEFQDLYPNITVTLRLYTDYGDIYNDVITNISTGTTPNVCITYPDHIATYLTGDNVVVPLDELLTDPAYGLGVAVRCGLTLPQRRKLYRSFWRSAT